MQEKLRNKYPKVFELREKLYRISKEDPKRRFHSLKDKLYRMDFLSCAWELVKENKGCAGIDNQTIEDIEKYGTEQFLQELADDIKDDRYRVKEIKRTYIPKSDGTLRPLGIPVIKDRIVQTALKLLIEPIFEADFQENSYGFREGKSPQDARLAIYKWLNYGCTNVYDADIKRFFDNIDHKKLMELIERKIADRYILRLIRAWLKAGIFEEGEIKEPEKGTPQGGVISPLLANIYLNELDKEWKESGLENRKTHDAKLVRYADDLVILSSKPLDTVTKKITEILQKLKLEINTEKTKITTAQKGFEFLGFHFKRRYSKTYNKEKTYTTPTHKAQNRIREKIREVTTDKRQIKMETKETVKKLNAIIRGWSNYYQQINARTVFRKIQKYTCDRLRKYLRKNKQLTGYGYKEYPDQYLYEVLHLYDMRGKIQYAKP